MPVEWRKEYEERKSGAHVGEIMPHWHLMVFGVDPDDDDRAWFAATWSRIVGVAEEKVQRVAGHRKSWEQVRTWNGVNAYIAKYMAKISEHEVEGRCWGWWWKHLLPIQLISKEIPQDTFYPVRRVLRNYLSRVTGRKFHQGASWQAGVGLTVYLLEATGQRLVEWAWDIGWGGTSRETGQEARPGRERGLGPATPRRERGPDK